MPEARRTEQPQHPPRTPPRRIALIAVGVAVLLAVGTTTVALAAADRTPAGERAASAPAGSEFLEPGPSAPTPAVEHALPQAPAPRSPVIRSAPGTAPVGTAGSTAAALSRPLPVASPPAPIAGLPLLPELGGALAAPDSLPAAPSSPLSGPSTLLALPGTTVLLASDAGTSTPMAPSTTTSSATTTTGPAAGPATALATPSVTAPAPSSTPPTSSTPPSTTSSTPLSTPLSTPPWTTVASPDEAQAPAQQPTVQPTQQRAVCDPSRPQPQVAPSRDDEGRVTGVTLSGLAAGCAGHPATLAVTTGSGVVSGTDTVSDDGDADIVLARPVAPGEIRGSSLSVR